MWFMSWLGCWAGGIVLSVVLAAGVMAQETKLQGALIRGPYVQMAQADSMTIVWRTSAKIQPVVKYGAVPDKLDQTVPAASISLNETIQKGVGSYAAEDVVEPGLCQYEARISGLAPLTTYYYGVYDGAKLLAGGDESYRFRTYPKAGAAEAVRFAAFGDSHGEGWLKTGVEQSLRGLCEKEKTPLSLYLLLGDLTNKGRNKEYQYLFEPGDVFRRAIVLWPTMGNHDIVSSPDGSKIVGPYCDAFVLPTQGEGGGAPSGTEAYYSFNYGRVHFVAIAAFHVAREADSPMAKWLKEDLAKAKADGGTDWVIAYVHSPPFTRHGSGNTSDREIEQVMMRAFIVPILEEGGVDMVLSGHMHVYERTKLIDGCYTTPVVASNSVLDDGDGDPKGDGAYRKSAGLNPHDGTVGVVVGIGGGPGQEGEHPLARRFSLDGGMLVVDVDGETLTARMMRSDGVIRDTFSIVKRGKVVTKRVANPKMDTAAVYYRRKLTGNRFALVPKVTDAVTLDGKLNDAAWQQGTAFKATGISDARVVYRDDGLYIGVDFDSGRPPTAREKEHDGPLYAFDHSLEIYIDPNHDGKNVYLFATNCLAAKRDAKNDDLSYTPAWDLKVVSGVGTKNEHWIAEMRIPWKAIGMDAAPDEKTIMGMNIVANRNGAGGEWFPGRGDLRFVGIQRPSQFGFVRFGAGRADSVIPPYDPWRSLTGTDPVEGWVKPEYDDKEWATAAPGYGYGDIDNTTRLLDMKAKYSRVYARHAFDLKDAAAIKDLALIVNYDDAFIAYLNGKEVLRVGVTEGAGAKAKGIAAHECKGPEYPQDQKIDRMTPLEGVPLAPEYFSLKAHLGLLRNDANVIAIEGHNASVTSKAFTLDPHVVAVWEK
jgi:hypothetical protein